MGPEEVRPAFYALAPGGWRDWVTLLHPPYTLWHLSYVAVGAALAPRFHLDRLLWALLAFALALGVAAHALDEVRDRPLRTHIPACALIAVAVASLAGAVAIGIGAAYTWGWWLLVLVAAGAILVPAYNLELAGGAIHTDWGFALAWGAFPALTGYVVEAQALHPAALVAVAYATALSLVQRRLSTPARRARREEGTVEGAARHERALRALMLLTVLLGTAAVAARLT